MSYNESLKPNSNYPPMSQSEWDSAPWNQEDPPEEDFNVSVSFSLSKDCTVTTDDWSGDEDYKELENPNSAYTDSYLTPDQLMSFAFKAASQMLQNKDYSLANKYILKEVVDSCKGWTVDEFNVEQL